MGISKRKLADGTIVFDVREVVGVKDDGDPDRRSVTCYSHTDAKREQLRLRNMKAVMRGRSTRITLREFVEAIWWPSAERSLSASTKTTYEKELRLRIIPSLGNVELLDINRDLIQRMIDRCDTYHQAYKALGLLKTLLNDCKGSLIPYNPAEARFRMPPKGRKRDNGLVITTFEGMRPVLEAVDEYGEETVRAIAALGLLMGLRPEERYGLDCDNVDDRAMTLLVSSAYTPASPRFGGNDLKEPKTEESYRTLRMSRAVADRLPADRRERTGPLLLGKGGDRISPSTARHRWDRFLEWCDEHGKDVPHVTIENMRHSFATSYLHGGGLVADLSRILGHADINTTNRRYVRPSAMDVARGMESVPEI